MPTNLVSSLAQSVCGMFCQKTLYIVIMSTLLWTLYISFYCNFTFSFVQHIVIVNNYCMPFYCNILTHLSPTIKNG